MFPGEDGTGVGPLRRVSPRKAFGLRCRRFPFVVLPPVEVSRAEWTFPGGIRTSVLVLMGAEVPRVDWILPGEDGTS